MGRYRLTLAGLMGIVLAFAVGFAALRNASRARAGATYLLTLGLLCTAVVGAVTRRGPWFGAAIFGWSYAILALGPWKDAKGADLPPATPLLKALLPYASPALIDSRGIIYEGPADIGVAGTGAKIFTARPYYQVGHCLIAWLFAATGALVGLVLAPRRDNRPSADEVESRP